LPASDGEVNIAGVFDILSLEASLQKVDLSRKVFFTNVDYTMADKLSYRNMT
jgi:hypothetical protein